MSWTRSLIAVLAVCVVLPAGTAGCGPSDTRERDGSAPSPVGRLLAQRDAEGRPYREVDGREAPEVGVEVVPDTDGGWDVRLRVRNLLVASKDGAQFLWIEFAAPHALESIGRYERWLHGEAVAIGTVIAAHVSQALGWLDDDDIARIRKALRLAGLPVSAPGS